MLAIQDQAERSTIINLVTKGQFEQSAKLNQEMQQATKNILPALTNDHAQHTHTHQDMINLFLNKVIQSPVVYAHPDTCHSTGGQCRNAGSPLKVNYLVMV